MGQARRMVDEYGFTSLKLKGGVLRPGLEIETVLALREAFPDCPIRVDPNAAWTVDVAVEVARRVSMPLAANVCVTEFEGIPEAVREGAPQVILSDSSFLGRNAPAASRTPVHEQRVKCGVRTRDDVAPMKAVDPEWTGATPRFTSL